MRSPVTGMSSLFGHLQKTESSEKNTDTIVEKNLVFLLVNHNSHKYE